MEALYFFAPNFAPLFYTLIVPQLDIFVNKKMTKLLGHFN